MVEDKIIDVEGKYVAVRAAEPIGSQVIDPVIITISGHYPTATKEDIDRLRQQFKIDAWKIFDGLRSLPGGTFDQLLILMLQKAASSFIVPHNFHDEEKPKPSMLALLEKALPIIVREAEQRTNWGIRHNEMEHRYATEMTELADEIEAEIDKAYAREVSEPDLCPHGFGFVEYCPDCKGKEVQHG